MSIEDRHNVSNDQLHPGIIPVEDGGERPVDGAKNINDGKFTIPATPKEGFESSPPTVAERAAFDQGRAYVRNSHETTTQTNTPNHRGLWIAGGAGLAAVLAAAGVTLGIGASHNAGAEDGPASNRPTVSAPVTPGVSKSPESDPSTTEAASGIQKLVEYRKSLQLDISSGNGEATQTQIDATAKQLGFAPITTTNPDILATNDGVMSVTDLLTKDITTLATAANVNKNNPTALNAINHAWADTHKDISTSSSSTSAFATLIINKATALKRDGYIKAESSKSSTPTTAQILKPVEVEPNGGKDVTIEFSISMTDYPEIPTEPNPNTNTPDLTKNGTSVSVDKARLHLEAQSGQSGVYVVSLSDPINTGF